ncbi:hypothetical protein C8Q79DRAFT_969435 [Trametes meyenii]|nr:hypothetical protein C8Q79DRAFT_969435 [Trametes meyenii]
MGHSVAYLSANDLPEDTQDQFRFLLTIVQLGGGSFLWLAVSRVPYDYRSIRKRRTSWAALMVYLLCRYVTVVGVIFEMIYVCSFPHVFGPDFGKLSLALRRFSMLLIFVVMSFRVDALWNHAAIRAATTTPLLALFGIIASQLANLDSIYVGTQQAPFASVLLFTSTTVSLLGILGVANVRRPTTPRASRGSPHSTRSSPSQYIPRGVVDTWKFVAVWLSSVAAVTIYFAFQHMDPFHRRAVGFVTHLIGVHLACHEYEKLAKSRPAGSPPSPRPRRPWSWGSDRRTSSNSAEDSQMLDQNRAADPLSISVVRRGPAGIVRTPDRDVFEMKAFSSDLLVRRHASGSEGTITVAASGGGAGSTSSEDGGSSSTVLTASVTVSSPAPLLSRDSRAFVRNHGRHPGEAG